MKSTNFICVYFNKVSENFSEFFEENIQNCGNQTVRGEDLKGIVLNAMEVDF